MSFSEILLDFRAENDLTQSQLASIILVSPASIFRYESGRSEPSKKNRIRIEKKMKEWSGKNEKTS